jgi:hypothetical protein
MLTAGAAQPPATQPPAAAAPAPDTSRAAVPAPATAAELLARARAARTRQDAALRSYDALSRERVTARMALLRDVPLDRTVFRQETAARVRWSADAGLELELLGRRRYEANLPLAPRVPDDVTGDGAAPVPYYPGRDPLWIGAAAFVEPGRDTAGLRNPLAPGAERWYRYALGDTVGIRVPGAAGPVRVTLRELRVTPHRAGWRVVAGSYWFDARSAQLVRAVYRPTATLDLMREGRRNPDPRQRPPRWLPLVASRVVGGIDAVTVEHGLYAGRVWLPRAQVAEGWVDGGPTRTRIRVEQTFRYDAVNSALPPARAVDPAALAYRARSDSARALDSLRAVARDGALAAARTRRDTARAWDAYVRAREAGWRALRPARDSARAASCPPGDTLAVRSATVLRYGRRLPARVFVPCDAGRLARADVFEGPLLADGEGDWRRLDPAGLRDALGGEVALAPWAPAAPVLRAGWEYTRYNRVEGLSTGAAVRRPLGRGWQAEANARFGFADRQPNAELFAEQTRDRRTRRAGAYRRLAQADDYGAAFGGGASIQNLVAGLDEQFYYRALGGELAGTRDAGARPRGLPVGAGRLEWRAFAERQDPADARARFAVAGRVFGRADGEFAHNVVDTVRGRGGTVAGGAVRWRGALVGGDASPWRLRADARAEAVSGAWSYVRPALDLTAERALPGAVVLRAAAGAGSALGELPPQRWWNVGGWQTVRGVVAGSRRGSAFWLARSEAEWAGWARAQPVVFVDAGWAGAPGGWGQAFRRAAGVQSAGAGVAFFGGLLRLDAARPLAGGRWRVGSYAVARF